MSEGEGRGSTESLSPLLHAVSQKFANLDGMASIMQQATMDRFAGYPDHPGYPGDLNVPFFDIVSRTNKYPLKWNESLPLDWEVQPMVTSENYKEHVGDRFSWYSGNARISTGTAAYRMQGACDPDATVGDPEYYSGCTTAHNNLTTGGVTAPTETNFLIERKARDLIPFLKPLYESIDDVKGVGIFFANAGAGSVITFPALVADGTMSPYISDGCDWAAVTNPRTGSPILSNSERNNCHPSGDSVQQRDYNPMDRAWCKSQALQSNIFKTSFYGPYKDAWSENLWLITIGRPVYDRLTGEFIACTEASVSVDEVRNHD